MLTNKLQTIWLELLDVNKQTTNYMLELLEQTNYKLYDDVNKQTTNYMARTTRC